MAVNGTLLLRVIRQFRRYYDRQFEALLASAGLSMREMDVVLFLANNPDCDTAREVSELRGLAKSQVSGAGDLLAERGLLDRASMVANCGMEGEAVYPRFAELTDGSGYFSVVLVKKGEEA